MTQIVKFVNADVFSHDSTHLLSPDLKKKLITDWKNIRLPLQAGTRLSSRVYFSFVFLFFFFLYNVFRSCRRSSGLSRSPCLDEGSECSRSRACAGARVQVGRRASQKVTVVVLLFRKVMVWMLERIFLWCPARVTPMWRRSLKQTENEDVCDIIIFAHTGKS